MSQVCVGLMSSLCNLDSRAHNGSLVLWRGLIWSSSGCRSANDGRLSAACRIRTSGLPNGHTWFLTHGVVWPVYDAWRSQDTRRSEISARG